MPDKPTFGRYSEIPYEQMTPEQQEAYSSLIETRGRLLSPTDPEFASQSRNDNRGHAERTVSSWSESPALLGSRRAERAGCGSAVATRTCSSEIGSVARIAIIEITSTAMNRINAPA